MSESVSLKNISYHFLALMQVKRKWKCLNVVIISIHGLIYLFNTNISFIISLLDIFLPPPAVIKR